MNKYLDISKAGSGVYCITCRINGKRYIGSTYNFGLRWSQHREQLRQGNHPNYRLQKDWDSYGEGNFDFGIIEHTQPAERLVREQFYMDHYRVCETGYNIQTRTQFDIKPVQSTRQALRSLKRKQFRK